MKNSIFLISIVLTIVSSSICVGQVASLQAYPDLHSNNIFSIDTDENAKNALSLSYDGRTVFWDLETRRPLRMWEFKGRGYLTKMIFNEGTGISLFGDFPNPNSTKLKKFHFVFYDLFDGIVYDTLSLGGNVELDIVGFDFAAGSERKQDVVLLYNDSLTCVDLYRKKIKWSLGAPEKSKDVYYLNQDTILIYTEDAVLYLDQKSKSYKPFGTEKIENFDRNNVRGQFHVRNENDHIVVKSLDPNSNNSFKFKNTAGIQIKTIYKITGNDAYSYLHMNLTKSSELALIDHKKEEIIWHKKIPSEKETIGILESAIALKASKVIYSDPTRRIKILDGRSGRELSEIENNIPDTRSTYITPDFKHMIYSSMGDGDNGFMPNKNKKATFYVDLSQPTNTQLLFEGVALKSQVTNNNSILILNDEGLAEFDINLRTYYTSTLTFPYPMIGKITDMEYDTLSGRMWIKSENKSKREELIVNNSEVRDLIVDGVKIGIVYNQFQLYGELIPIDAMKSKFIFDQNVTFVYNKDYLEPLAFIYKKDGNFKPTFVRGGRYVIMDGEGISRNEKLLFDVKTTSYINPYKESKVANIVNDLYSDLVLFRYEDNTCILMETNELKEVKRFKLNAFPASMVLNSKLGTIIFNDYSKHNKLYSYDIEDGDLLEIDGVYCLKFQDLSADGKYLALSNFKAVQIVDVQNGTHVTNEVKEFEAEPDFVKFSKDKNMAVSCRKNGRLNFWNLDKKRVNATFMLSPEGKYVVYDNLGVYDCHPDAMNQIFYTVRKETVDLDQLKYIFWKEDMLSHIIANETYDFEKAKEEKIIRLYPDVELSTSEFQDTLIVKLSPNLGGLGQVSFFINNVEREEDVNPNDTLAEISIPIAQYEDYLIPGRPNILGVVVYNSDHENEQGLLKSKQKRIPIQYGVKRSTHPFSSNSSKDEVDQENQGVNDSSDSTDIEDRPLGTPVDPAATDNDEEQLLTEISTKGGWDDEIEKAQALMLDIRKTRLIGLVVGTSDYSNGNEIDLRYADNDANSIENALNKTGKLLFKQDSMVIIHKLISKSTDTTLTSTKKNILAKMEEIQKDVKVDDILVLFFSGHGFSHDQEYYYATKDATSNTLNGKDPSLSSKTISAHEINDFLKESKSLRKLLILDACYSGAFAEAINKKSGTNSQRKAMDRIKDKTGVYVLSSSLANQESLEMPTLSQGVMTYSLLDGMSGKAAIDHVIDVSTLINHVIDHVPELAKQKGYSQQPVFITPEASMPFAIGLSDKSIAPTGSKLQIGKAAVQDSMDTDYLLLNEAIDDAVRVTSEQQANIPFMFNDLVTSNNIRIKGNYFESTEGIKLDASIIRDNVRIKKISVLEKTKNEVANTLVQELIKLFGSS